MKPSLSHEQMTMIIARATRERNAAIGELFATLPSKVLDWAARGFEKLVEPLRVDASRA